MERFRRDRPAVAGAILTLIAGLVCSACADELTHPATLPGVNISVTPPQLTLHVGDRASLVATVEDLQGRPLAGRQVRWASSAPGIVSVSSTGEVTALDVGSALVGAYSDQGVGFARVVVQIDFRLPLVRWLVLTEIGTPAPSCPENEGGLRIHGGRDCSHSGASRYSLDLGDPTKWADLPGSPMSQVVAAAEGIIAAVCLQPPTITCGPDGPYVVIEHRGGFTTIYAHLDPESVVLRRKTRVSQGQPLGMMGAWAADPAPWLHFELRYDNGGATSASVLGTINVGGRRMMDYKADGLSPYFSQEHQPGK
jgi:hypothetical protein